MTARAVLFDLDGVLVDSFRFWLSLMNDAARSSGHPELDPAALRRSWGQDALADARQFFPGWTAARVTDFYDANLDSHALLLTMNPEAVTALAALRSDGVAIGLVTNSSRRFTGLFLEVSGLSFDAVVTRDDVDRPKPDPDGILMACRALDIPAAEAVYVGDTECDRQAAIRAAARFVGVGPAFGDAPARCLSARIAEAADAR